MNKNIRFTEQQRVDPALMALLGAGFLLESYLAITQWRESRVGSIISMLALVLFLALAVILRQLTVQVVDDELSFGFSFIRKRIKLCDIGASSITEASMKTTGIGIHLCPGRFWAWVAKSGPALKITMASGSVTGYIISTSRPRDLTAAISSQTGPGPTHID